MENPYKMSYHIEPPQGLLNDPNGLIQFKDTYYFFHQWNRFRLDHTYKEWGLFTSKDLVHWEGQGTALVPDREEDSHGIHSGSSIEHDGKLYIFYTGSNKDHGIRKSRQCTAISEDGRIFIKQTESVDTPDYFTEHHRDPKVWRGKNNWWMLVGTQKKDLTGAAALYSSTDLIHWSYENVLYDQALDQVCECPDLFSLNNGEIDILVCCPQKRTLVCDSSGSREEVSSYAAYIPGVFLEDDKAFIPKEERKLFDHGFDFYSPQTFTDSKGRRIMTGWMSRMSDEQETACPTRRFGYLHCLTLPRILTWENGRLYQRPVEEVFGLRHNARTYSEAQAGFDTEHGHFELLLIRKQEHAPLSLSIRNHTVEIQYLPKDGILQVSRADWAGGAVQTRELSIPELFKLQIFSDNSSAEIFVNDGAAVFSMRYFTDAKNLRVEYAGLQQGERLKYFTL